MPKQPTVISLDPIDQAKKLGIIGRLLITKWYKGKSVIKTDDFGHYMFCGEQRSGKTASFLWYAEYLRNYYRKRSHRLLYEVEDTGKFKKFKDLPKVRLYSNFGVGKHINRETMFKTIDELDPYANEVRIFLIDEVHTYFPKDNRDKKIQFMINDLNAVFSQLAKRNAYVLSTAQIYGRLDKALREQCLFMIDCKVNIHGRIVNDFIPQKSIIADDLGRWSGRPKHIKVHGLSTIRYNTKKLIRD